MYWPQIPALITLATVFGLTSACGGAESDDHPGAGSPNGGSVGGVAGAVAGSGPAGGKSAGGSGGTAGQGAVDCEAVCAHVKTLCPDRADISDVWLSACKSVCDARLQLTPDTAKLEQACVEAAETCNAAITCVATPG
jgi:hypothetical protein